MEKEARGRHHSPAVTGGASSREVIIMKRTAFVAVFMVATLMVAGFAVATPGLKVETDKNVYTVGEDV